MHKCVKKIQKVSFVYFCPIAEVLPEKTGKQKGQWHQNSHGTKAQLAEALVRQF